MFALFPIAGSTRCAHVKVSFVSMMTTATMAAAVIMGTSVLKTIPVAVITTARAVTVPAGRPILLTMPYSLLHLPEWTYSITQQATSGDPHH